MFTTQPSDQQKETRERKHCRAAALHETMWVKKHHPLHCWRIIHRNTSQDALLTEERLITSTCSHLPVSSECMWGRRVVTLCSTQTYSFIDALVLLTLASTHHKPITLCLCSYRSAKHFNPSLSLRLWRQPQMINQRQADIKKATPKVPCLHTFPTILLVLFCFF